MDIPIIGYQPYASNTPQRDQFSDIMHFKTAQEAYDAYLQNKQIWKVSFIYNGEPLVFTNKLKREMYNPASELKMWNSSLTYRNAKRDEVFWIRQYLYYHLDMDTVNSVIEIGRA